MIEMNIWFQDWTVPARLILVAIFAYAGLIVMLRISGKRTLSKMNAFDFVVTIALGSTLATVLLSKDVSLAEGLLALSLLVGLQWVVAWMSIRSTGWRNAIKSEPRLLALRGEYQEQALRAERVTPDEVDAAVRGAGHSSVAEVAAVVLETDGSFSVIATSSDERGLGALKRVRGFRDSV